jgi:hypothetical protein
MEAWKNNNDNMIEKSHMAILSRNSGSLIEE